MKTQLMVKLESMELYFKHRYKIIEEFARIYTPDCIRLSIMNVVMENNINYAKKTVHISQKQQQENEIFDVNYNGNLMIDQN